jgi:hypothetical protein
MIGPDDAAAYERMIEAHEDTAHEYIEWLKAHNYFLPIPPGTTRDFTDGLEVKNDTDKQIYVLVLETKDE